MTNTYWRERFQIYEEATNKSVLELQESLRTEYLVAQKDIETKIRSWYQKFADNNEITMAEAKKWLSKSELKEFAWSVDEYIKYATDNLDDAWTKQLINASTKVHISRLEALEIECQQTLERLFGNEVDSLDDFLKASYAGSYTNTAYEIQKGLNLGFDVASISDTQLENIICKPWTVDGRTFSDKIWNRKNELVSELHSQLTQTVLQGKNPQDVIKAIAKKFGDGDMDKGSLYNAGRLVMTESAYFNSLGKMESFKDLGIEFYQIDATLDSHTSEVCQSKDGLVFEMKYFEPTVTAPPFHPWCRTTTVPYFKDEFTASDLKAARNADGEVYNVPADMTYEKWQETFLDGGDKDGLNILNVFEIK